MSRPRTILVAAQRVASSAPGPLSTWAAARLAAAAGPRLMADKAAMLARHLRRVERWRGDVEGDATAPAAADHGDRRSLVDHGDRRSLVDLGGHRSPIDDAVAAGFGSYGRYWVDSLRLPTVDDRELDRAFSFVGYEKLEAIRSELGLGPILVLPHLGSWEWAAAWMGRIAGVGLTAVVERLEPPDVFDWFVGLRTAYGVNVVPLGEGALFELMAAVRRRDIVCLLSDRDIAHTGRSVEFFGEETSLPVGPALLSRRTGSPLVPTAVFIDGRRRRCVIGEPISPQGRSYQELLAATAAGLEDLIVRAPQQWHLLNPNWPSDEPR